MVLVLDKRKKPLMPCTPKRARLLLARGRAVVHRVQPFVIRLKDRRREESALQEVALKIDPGSKTTGIALARGEQTEEGEVHHALLLAEVAHRGEQVHRHKVTQAQARRRRRSANLRYRPPRFLHRRTQEGWLPPSLLSRMLNVVTWTARLSGWCPVSRLEVERVRFDTHLLQNPDLAGAAVRAGRLRTLDITATGRGDHCRTLWTDKGFPRGYKLRRKMVAGFATGDRVRAIVPETLKTAGTHVGRVAVRTSRSFAITTGGRKVDGIHARYCVLIQRGDGYEYALTQQVGKWSLSSPRPPKKEPLLPPLTQAKGSPQLEIRS